MSREIPQFEKEENNNNENDVEKPFISNGNGYTFLNGKSNGSVDDDFIDDRSDEDRRCGFGFYSPEWLQPFASKKTFVLVFSGLAIIQTMAWAYFTATLTTLEKRFKISSETMGIVMTGNEISSVLFSLALSYYGGKGNRPRWIAIGILASALSCLTIASPHLFYGAGSDALSLTEEYTHMNDIPQQFKNPQSINNASSLLDLMQNSTATNVTEPKVSRSKVQTCNRYTNEGGSKPTDCSTADTSLVPLVLIFMSQFILGIGVILFWALGGPYLDDNVKKTKSPFVFGLTMALRLVGPTFGYLLAASSLKMYISPWLTPIITTSDPRWMGAWWLGWVILGFFLALSSVFIAMFPKELPRAVSRKKLAANMAVGAGGLKSSLGDLNRIGSQMVLDSKEPAEDEHFKVSELPNAIKSLMTNKVNLFNTLAGVFYMFSAIGYWTFMPKYMETIFRQTAVNASVISGTVSIAFQAIGLLVSGALISKFQPSARKLAAWNVILGLVYVVSKASFTQFGCDQGNLMLGTNTGDNTWNLTESCNMDCNCQVNKMQPVCYKEKNQVFYSTCHAGCSSFVNGTISDCSCLPTPEDTVTLGTCVDENCYSTFVTFLAINCVIKLLDSSGRVGNMLVAYRCVDPKEKSLAVGVVIFLTSIFAFLPAPILFGKIFDTVCLVWGTKCGARGNCWLYDGERLRYYLNLTAAAFAGIGAIFDALVWYYVDDLDLYDEEKNVANRILKKQESERRKQQARK